MTVDLGFIKPFFFSFHFFGFVFVFSVRNLSQQLNIISSERPIFGFPVLASVLINTCSYCLNSEIICVFYLVIFGCNDKNSERLNCFNSSKNFKTKLEMSLYPNSFTGNQNDSLKETKFSQGCVERNSSLRSEK